MATLRLTCPNCGGTLAVPYTDNVEQLVGCLIGCVGCGKRLACEPPGTLVVEDDSKHREYTKPLPKRPEP